MAAPYLMGVDLGTMGLKTTIYDLNGEKIAYAYQEYPLDSPYPNWAQQDVGSWWKALVETTRHCLKQPGVSPDDILAIGVCGQSHGPVPVSKTGEPLNPCITWVDRRSEDQVKYIVEKIGEKRVFEINGLHVDAAYTASKLLWIKENLREVFDKTYKFLLPKDYLVLKLTGQFSADRTDAFPTNLFDIRRRRWSEELLILYGIPKDKLCEIHEPWEVVGEVLGEVAEETGLKKGTPVVAGGGDWACTFYGAGFVKPGRGVNMTGTVDGILIASDKFMMDFKEGFSGWTHIVPGLYAGGFGGTQAAGSILRWFRDELFTFEKAVCEKHGISPYALMDIEADSAPPGSGGILITPNFIGQRRPENPNSRGVIYGLTLATKRAQIIRAMMEGIAYNLRMHLERARSRGIVCEEMRAIGGGAKSKVWRQIKADILRVPYCRINIDEGGDFGVAILAGVGVKAYNDLVKPIEDIVHVTERNEPREEYKERYDKLFKLYLKLEQSLEKSGMYEEYMETMSSLNR